MFERYWREYIDAKIAEKYYFFYIHHSKRRLIIINAICLIMSFTGVATWVSQVFDPRVSSLIILASQIISVLQPLYPYADRIYAANCIFNEMHSLVSDAEQKIQSYLFDSISDSELHDELIELQKKTIFH